MSDNVSRSYVPGQLTCNACEKQLSRAEFITLQAQDQAFPVCESFDCRQVISAKEAMPAVFFKRHLEFHRRQILEKRRVRAEKEQYQQRIQDKESTENKRVLDRFVNTQLKNLCQTPVVISIPTGRSQQQALSEDRRHSYQSHLQTIIKEAFSDDPPRDVFEQVKSNSKKLAVDLERFANNPSLGRLSEHLCATCKGGCCTNGGNRGYLNVSTMVRVRESFPDHSADDLLNEYVSRLSDHPIEDSCINHTPTGCVLPRELRSEVCNTFFCTDLHAVHDMFEASTSVKPVLAVKRSNHHWNRFDPTVENEIVDVVLFDEGDIQFVGIELIDTLQVSAD